jgi:RNase adapter protein RapZ
VKREPLDLIVITGMSGAGRSAAADVLEDRGYFVIDNLPAGLIPNAAELASGGDSNRYAFVVDVRSGAFVDELETALAEVRQKGARTRTLFLDAGDDSLVRRFDESRRVHPLANTGQVSDGIAAERELLADLKARADVIVDTTNLNVHELRDRLGDLFDDEGSGDTFQTSIVSFGYKHGLPVDADVVFDCRFLPNPHWVDELRPSPGTDPAVRDYVLGQPEALAFLDELERLFGVLFPGYQREGKAYLTVAVGCTGGRHRSVVIANELATIFSRLGITARVRHRDLDRG